MSNIQKLDNIVYSMDQVLRRHYNATLSNKILDKEAHNNRMHKIRNSVWCQDFRDCEFCITSAE